MNDRRSALLHSLFGATRLWLLAFLLLSPLFGGCGGCINDPIKAQQEAAKKKAEEEARLIEEERKKKEKPKPDHEIGRLMTQPNGIETLESIYKPGHWTSATVDAIANNDDFRGELVTQPFELDRMPFNLGTSRPVTLAKGQRKFLEMTLFVPPGKKNQKIATRLLNQGGREMLPPLEHPALRMPEYQFYLFAVARDADRYGFIKDLHAVRPPTGSLGDAKMYYRVMLPKIENRTPLPTNPLCWTSIAYVLWDDMEPDCLTPEQQAAMIDWLHWGGQVIVSGPGSLDLLKQSFLEPYLPALSGGPWDIGRDELTEFNAKWTPESRRPLLPAKPWSGVKLEPHEQAVIIDKSGELPLVVERRIGRGRVVVTAFRLNQREINDWKSFDGFLNAALLRRPPRKFDLSNDAELRVGWAHAPPSDDVPEPQMKGGMFGWGYQQEYVELMDRHQAAQLNKLLNPKLASNVNYYTRDMSLPTEMLQKLSEINPDKPSAERQLDAFEAFKALREAIAGDATDVESIGAGVAGWNDFNPVADFARMSLRGGIVIPDSSFIVWVLLTYLTVLVPVNWAVFRAIGRVEWAWIAAPVITVAFAVGVVKLAQLDVGFVRTKSEVGLVELQAGFKRAHVTRYTALYTSLSTTYDLQFDDPGGLVQPFPTRSELLTDQTRTTVNYRRAQSEQSAGKSVVGLDGFVVNSNSQSMLHSEHMSDLGGGILLQVMPDASREVVNNTHLDLQGAGVIGPEGAAWIGKLPAGAAAKLDFKPIEDADIWLEERDESPVTARNAPPEVLNIRYLLQIAQFERDPQETRLIAFTDEEIPGLAIEPASSQARFGNVVLAHLCYGVQPLPVRDVNTVLDVLKEEIKAEDEKQPQPQNFEQPKAPPEEQPKVEPPKEE